MTDINGQTASAGVAVTVTSAAGAPTAVPDTATVVEGNGVLIDVLANDVGTGLTLTSVTTPAHGTAAIQSGKVLYTAANWYVSRARCPERVPSPPESGPAAARNTGR